jgi:hypothetical protein
VPIRVLDTNDCDAAFAFLDSTVSPRGLAHWRWKYRLDTAELPTGYYWQDSDGRVLGFIGLMRTTLHAGEQRHPAAWFVDWHVTPGERGVGVGLGLLRKAEAAAGVLLTLQGSADTRQILPRLGWKQSPVPATWVRPLSPRFIADWTGRKTPPGSWLSGAGRLVGTVAGPYFRCRKPAVPADVALVDVQRFPADYDKVWQTRAAQFAAALARDSGYVNYLCADYPDDGYRLQLMRVRHETAGHLLWRVDPDGGGFQCGRIVDLLWPQARPELAAWLIQSAGWQLQQAGADYIECVASVPELQAALRRTRFRARRSVPIWFHRLPAGVPDPDRWHITFLDCDRAYR